MILKKSEQNSEQNNNLKKCLEELDKIPNAETIRKAEELYRQLSYMSAKDLFQPFTI